ncbi:hypothetical protein QAD02_009687 [Eretmocerus hayati]|uniref:Uncharacterized protein n=1 Tax=Eretmocerus hayati TaxID=131215 RepID=A0ACC2NAE3_9HYME|nr:hypothetical protein QAD02_009687 [Eretmocerus hayati]
MVPNYSAIDKSGSTAFDIAISEAFNESGYGRAFDIMEVILSFHTRANNEVFNDRGFSMLQMLCTHSNPAMNKIEEHVLNHPLDLNKTVNKINTPWDEFTPLHFAANKGMEQLAICLIRLGANIHIRDDHGDTPIHLGFKFSLVNWSLFGSQQTH